MGCDKGTTKGHILRYRFQSTRPHGGRHVLRRPDLTAQQFQSTRSAWERDQRGDRTPEIDVLISIHSLRGERDVGIHLWHHTRSLISIHSLRVGARPGAVAFQRGSLGISIHSLRVGARLFWLCIFCCLMSISIRAFRGGNAASSRGEWGLVRGGMQGR